MNHKPVRRRGWPWIIALALVALMAGIIFWPRHDEYAFLRGLHPIETDKNYPADAASGTPAVRVHMLGFKQGRDVVNKALIAGGAKRIPDPDMMPDWGYQLPNGVTASLMSDATLVIYEEPTWIQAQIEAIRGFFHL